jgi:predicted cation transporter
VVAAALILSEAVSLLRLDRRAEIATTVFGCFAIGLGGGLTPLGMPASSLVLAALHEDFWYLARLLGPFVLAGIVLVAIPILFLSKRASELVPPLTSEGDSWAPVLIRAGKVYIFIAGLVSLSAGLRPVVDHPSIFDRVAKPHAKNGMSLRFHNRNEFSLVFFFTNLSHGTLSSAFTVFDVMA